MKHGTLKQIASRSRRYQPLGWGITAAVAVGLAASAFGQAYYEQRFNDTAGVEFEDGATIGADGSGVSGKPADKAYSADIVSAPKASAVITSGTASATADELTITAWYKPRAELTGPVTLFNAFAT